MSSDYEGHLIEEADAAKMLGFTTVDEYRRWKEAGSPVLRCANEHCARPVAWPATICKYCGSPGK